VAESFDQTNATETVSAEISIPTAHIPLTHVSNSSGDSKGIGLDNSHKANDYDDLYYGGPDNSIPSSMEKELMKFRQTMIVIVATTMILKKRRCQMIRMMMDIMDVVDIMNMVNVIEVIIIVTEDTKGKTHQ
jgi:hypothetical protein